MPINKLYGGTADRTDLLGAVKPGDICTYHFSIFFNPGAECSLFLLEAKTSKGTIWHPLVHANETDNDGEITIEIGKIKVGIKMDFRFGIYAIDELQNVRAVITNTHTGKAQQISPEDPTDTAAVKKMILTVLKF